MAQQLSILIPVRDEAESLPMFHHALLESIASLSYETEILYIENGSQDGTIDVLTHLEDAITIVLQVDSGIPKSTESAAIQAGIDHASGDIIATIDADLQNDPADLSTLLAKLEEGYDAVIGWRRKRTGPWSMRIVSHIGQLCRSLCGFSDVHDPGCGLKVYRRACTENITLFGELERFFPDLLIMEGWRVTEVAINHYPRLAGRTKYPWTKGLRALSDLLGLWFWRRFADRPLQFFGSFGILLVLAGTLMWITICILRVLQVLFLAGRIWPLIATTMLIIGLQLLFFGFLSDILARMHFSAHKPYQIKTIIRPSAKKQSKTH